MTAITLDQAWINTELCIGINHSLKQMSGDDESVLPRKCINRSRIILAVSLTIFVIGSVVYYTVVDNNKDLEGRLEFINNAYIYYIPSLQATACILLTASIVVLLVNLKKLGKVQVEQRKVFERERLQVLFIFALYDLSCILRGIYDHRLQSSVMEKESFTFGWTLSLVYSFYILDVLPILLILYYHSINFKTINQAENLQEES